LQNLSKISRIFTHNLLSNPADGENPTQTNGGKTITYLARVKPVNYDISMLWGIISGTPVTFCRKNKRCTLWTQTEPVLL